MKNELIHGDALTVLPTLLANSQSRYCYMFGCRTPETIATQ